MTYNQRLATLDDTNAIAFLWKDFVQERAKADPSMIIKPDFDFEQYVSYQLKKPLSYCFVLEQSNILDDKAIVGFLFTYVYDEAPPPELPGSFDTPFKPRRVGTTLGLYVQENHRYPETVKLLIEASLRKAEDLKITDIDLLISAEQTGIHGLLERFGFTKAAVQYTKHYQVNSSELPHLSSTYTVLDKVIIPVAKAIPLRDLKTNEVIQNSQGEIVYLYPLSDETGQILKSSNGLSIYPTPVRDPQTNDWVFDEEGKLVVCPVLRDENGQIVEVQGIPQFCSPLYERRQNKLLLKKDANGHYLFSEVERDSAGKIIFDNLGKPIFKTSLSLAV